MGNFPLPVVCGWVFSASSFSASNRHLAASRRLFRASLRCFPCVNQVPMPPQTSPAARAAKIIVNNGSWTEIAGSAAFSGSSDNFTKCRFATENAISTIATGTRIIKYRYFLNLIHLLNGPSSLLHHQQCNNPGASGSFASNICK